MAKKSDLLKLRRDMGREMVALKREEMTAEDFAAWRRGLAFHEAGHAVVAYSHGGGAVKGITIAPTWELLGEAVTEGKVCDRAAVLMAGIMAEAKATGEDFDTLLEEMKEEHSIGQENDWTALLQAQEVGRTQTHYPLLNIETGTWWCRELLDDPATWAAVEALANALLEKETLTGRQATRIIEKAMKEAE